MHPDDPMIMLLESGQLLSHVGAIAIGDLAITCRDDNFHLNLLCSEIRSDWVRRGGVRPADLVFDPTIAC
jgi:hypothetical protein